MSLKNRYLLISCEHASAHVPKDFQSLFLDNTTILTTHHAYDIGAIVVAKQCAGLANHAVYGNITRLLIDLNRSLTNRSVFSAWRKRLSEQEKRLLIDNYYQPYRDNVIKHVEQAINQGVQVCHISVHSFTPVWHDILRTADLGLLYDPSRNMEAAMAKTWKNILQHIAASWRVRCNYPYRGTSDGLTSALRQLFSPKDYIGFELEINQALLLEPTAQQQVAALIYQSLVTLLS